MTDLLERPAAVTASAPRVDGVEKVTGSALYGADLDMAGTLHGKLVLSTHAHARIRSIDVSAALKVPGVRAVITGRDFPQEPYGGGDDRWVLCPEKVTYVGDKVAAVAADNLDAAEQAAALVRVDYEPLPEVFDPLESLLPGAPVIHEHLQDRNPDLPEYGRNVAGRRVVERGEPESAFAECDLVVEGTYVTQRAHQAYLEPKACSARVDRAGNVYIWTTTQGHFSVRDETARALGIPIAHIRVVASVIGGGFGGKIDAFLEPVAVVLAQRSGRPVKMVLSRREEFLSTQVRCQSVIQMRTGVRSDGTIVARTGRFVFDVGSQTSGTEGLLESGQGAYRIPHLRIEALGVYTNHLPTSSFRAPGAVQIHFASECQLDEIAARLKIDPAELRRRNLMHTGDPWASGAAAGKIAVESVLERALEMADWAARERRTLPDGRRTGWGIGLAAWFNWDNSASSATVTVMTDGTVGVTTGSVDIAGTNTALSQLAAEIMDVPFEQVSIATGDTSVVPYHDVTAGSRTMTVTGKAVLDACQDARRQLAETYAELTGLAPDQVELRGGMARRAGASPSEDPGLTLAELAARRQEGGQGPVLGGASTSEAPSPPCFACQIAEVAVDPETGRTEILRLIASQDFGRIFNASGARGQVVGGAVQGLGFGLFEQHLCKEGVNLNPTLLDYQLPTVLDVPMVETGLIEEPAGSGPLGARGAGEPPIIPTPAAIANAIRDAVGVAVHTLPLTPERVWRALSGRPDQPPELLAALPGWAAPATPPAGVGVPGADG